MAKHQQTETATAFSSFCVPPFTCNLLLVIADYVFRGVFTVLTRCIVQPLSVVDDELVPKGTSSLSHEDANLESVNELQSPPRIRTRGRPKNRLGSKLEKQIANATKKKKTKVLSEINLFDAASMAHSNSSQYQGHVMNYQFRVPAAGDNSLGV
ncbi:uncharacterized protein LOC110271424 [Arachis ipaensis]|uniref:uncharacterized protein LOC110271424 n=1 Tax=Arachis ipaensis TaxID=130454 RepID=UPI000A2B75B0|nr:uncharacterized protein LOC110271424 [Arachis ipaensis]